MHPQDDLFVVQALLEFSLDRRNCQPDRADRAYAIAESMVAEHGLALEDAILQID